jgi:RimJ/RimL family protein N-acetyltransferase
MEYRLRPWHSSDLDALCKYADNAKIARYMTDRFPHPYTRDAGKKFIDFVTSPENLDRFRVIEANGKFVGGTGIHPQDDVFRKNAEIAYWLAESHWNKGLATQVVNEMTTYGFKTFDITRVFARVFGTNHASARVLEKAGYTLENTIPNSIIKNNEIEDCLIYSIRKY